MYVQGFGLAREPFSIAPDPRFLFMSERHREALAHLLYGLQGGGGFVLLTGEIGAGKTTVCRCFLEQMPAACNVAYIFNPRLTVTELLKSICDEFHVELPAAVGQATVKDYLDPLNAFLLKAHAEGRNNVLIIDEAQNLSAELLEQLRLLTNLETHERKLLQIILIGQPELRDILAQPALAPLAQRVIARYHLDALSASETEAYVRHRLSVAGMKGALPFDGRALRRVHALARGVPRRINLLCDRALLGAYAIGRDKIDRRIVEHAASEVFDDRAAVPSRRRQLAWAAGGGAVAGAALLAGAATLLGSGSATPSTPALGATMASASAASTAQPRSSSAAASLASVAVPSASAAVGPRPAPAPGAASSAAALSTSNPTDIGALWPALAKDENAAWLALASLWPNGVKLRDPCGRQEALRCHRAASVTLAQIRQLDRPGLLTLQDDAGGKAYALLVGLSAHDARLQVGGAQRDVPLASLARWWRGDFLTLWRSAEDASGSPIADRGKEPDPQWLAARLPVPAADAASQPLRARIATFQLAQGLKADGVAGPMTLMQLNRSNGVAEPHLTQEK